MGDIEFGICDICKKKAELSRKYYHYDIDCECHSPKHFEFISHCKDCEPKEPSETRITFKTANLTKVNG